MIELILLKFFLSVGNYAKYRDSIKLKKEDRELLALYKVLDSIHDKYNRDISFQEFRLAVLTEFPEYTELLEQISATDIGEDMLANMVKQAVERSLAHDLALLSIDVSEGRKPLLDLLNFFPKFEDEQELNEQEEFVTDDIEELFQETKHKPGLRWRLKALNQSLGSLRKGDFGFLFARPETGKTTFLAEEVTFMAGQLPEEAGPILWFNNEEGGMKVKVRIMQASLGCTNNRLFEDRPRSYAEYIKRTRGKILLKDSATITRREIERLCKELKPSLIIFDQIDKVKGFDNDREDLRLGAIYIWAREMAKRYCPVIGVCQADVTGENKKYLTMDNVANAKCLAPKTNVLMFDGSWKHVQDIEVGEQVMGVDSTPRNVTGIASGEEEMFSVQHKIGGDIYVVNKSHILSLIDQKGNYVDKNILEYKNQDFGYRVGHTLPEQVLPIDPYFLGLWLGDGGKDKAEITTIDYEVMMAVKDECSNWGCTYTQYLEKDYIVHARMKYKQGVRHPFLNKLKELDLYKNKHIPQQYFKGSVEQRLSLIAGMIDTDGTKVTRKHEYYVFSNANYLLAFGIKQLALSCGLMATFKQRGKYYYVSISGNDLSVIPCRIERKKSTYKGYKNVLKSRLNITSLGVDKYAGICIDGDHKFIIEGNIVTHNTSKQAEADWILGIGAVHDEGLKYMRYLNISKNKLSGDESTIPELRHGKCEVLIQPDITRYKDIQ